MPAAPARTLPVLRRALAEGRALDLTYHAPQRTSATRRIVRPLALDQSGERWYLCAYCTTGFDDSFIYQQTRMPVADRAIPTVQILADEAKHPFEVWKNQAGKVPY
jgi:hypothetical protein